jgi:mediator of RNA polymerase II transcription subunit 5
VCATTHVLVIVPSTSSGGCIPPLMPVFLHLILPGVITKMDREFSSNGSSSGSHANLGLNTPGGGLNSAAAPTNPKYVVQLKLLASVLSSSLLAAFHTEWAWRSICREQKYLLGQSSRLMARGLADKLKVKKSSQTSRLVGQAADGSPGRPPEIVALYWLLRR